MGKTYDFEKLFDELAAGVDTAGEKTSDDASEDDLDESEEDDDSDSSSDGGGSSPLDTESPVEPELSGEDELNNILRNLEALADAGQSSGNEEDNSDFPDDEEDDSDFPDDFNQETLNPFGTEQPYSESEQPDPFNTEQPKSKPVRQRSKQKQPPVQSNYSDDAMQQFVNNTEIPDFGETNYNRSVAYNSVQQLNMLIFDRQTGLEYFVYLVNGFKKEYTSKYADALDLYKVKISRVSTPNDLKVVKAEFNKLDDIHQVFKTQSITLDNMLSKYTAIPNHVGNLRSMRNSCSDADALKSINTFVDGPIANFNGGAVDYLRQGYADYLELQSMWGNYDTVLSELINQLNATEERIKMENTITQEISQVAQENATTAFSQFGSGSNLGMFVSINALEDILMTAIDEYLGGNYDIVQSFGVSDAGDIFINEKTFNIANHIELTSEEAMKIPQSFRAEITSGKWGCIYNFKRLHLFKNLHILHLEYAPARKIDALRDLGINKGKWTNLFKRKSKFPMLQEIRLPEPEGVITRDSKPSIFKSNREYEEFTARNNFQAPAVRNNSQSIDEHNRQALQNMGANAMNSLSRGLETFKTAIWSKPLPRTLIKTFGYGAGIPMYWGLMTALGPVGVVMGALGIGAMAHYEYKQFKSSN